MFAGSAVRGQQCWHRLRPALPKTALPALEHMQVMYQTRDELPSKHISRHASVRLTFAKPLTTSGGSGHAAAWSSSQAFTCGAETSR